MDKKVQSEKRKGFSILLKWLGIILLVLIAAIGVIVVFSMIDKADPINALPPDFSVYMRTDSIIDSVEPLLDLEAADIILSDPSFAAARELLFQLRTADLRDNFLLRSAASRRVDIAVYDDNRFLAIIDMGAYSAVTRWEKIPVLNTA